MDQTSRIVPEVIASLALQEELATIFSSGNLADFEIEAQEGTLSRRAFFARNPWLSFVQRARELYRVNDFVVLRGLPATEDGVSLLVASLAGGSTFRTYRGAKVVKKFRMSPWTQDLSHTTREGDFHTDLNTEIEPPALTAIQCLERDPGAPEYGQNRVAKLVDIMAQLEASDQGHVAEHLAASKVIMANGREREWRGTIVDGGTIRYHPVTLRAALGQSPEITSVLEELIQAVHKAALTVSAPFGLDRGDVLLVSNRRALHYRGECSVRFSRFPTDYQSRSIFVLHQLDEPL